MMTNFFIPELNNHDVQELWFQQDGATCHTARATIDLLKDMFGDRLISQIVGSSGHEKVPTCGKSGLERPGRPRGERIVRQALVDPTVTRSTIRADVGVAIVPQTISRYLAEANLKSKRPFRALRLTTEHRQLRLQWCQARSMWNVTDWQKVVFSDESRFVLGTDDNRVRVWRRPGERYNSPTLFYVTLPAQLV
ncbi:HTH_Tnp_Tc3_2 domain-containing protein [Trichonephila clavipes]|nr:HTH_Tnp_Tc3_2 domain-containing protein [Trichonephila clavipes]